MNKHILLIILALFSITTHAQNEHWESWLTKIKGKPGSILVDLSLKSKVGDSKFPFLVVTGPVSQRCGDNGIPDTKEIDSLEDMLGATGNYMLGVSPILLAGTFTYNCERLNYYYVKDTSNIRHAINRMYYRNFPNYNFILQMKSDPLWNAYTKFLYPNDTVQNMIENNKILTSLLNSGDSLKGDRTITIGASFASVAVRDSFKNAINSMGYKIEREGKLTQKNALNPEYITLTKIGPVKADSINNMTFEIKKYVNRFNGDYLQWQCSKPKD